MELPNRHTIGEGVCTAAVLVEIKACPCHTNIPSEKVPGGERVNKLQGSVRLESFHYLWYRGTSLIRKRPPPQDPHRNQGICIR